MEVWGSKRRNSVVVTSRSHGRKRRGRSRRTRKSRVYATESLKPVLCDDIWNVIISFLDAPLLLSLGITCRNLYELCSREDIWERLCMGNPTLASYCGEAMDLRPGCNIWKDIYLSNCFQNTVPSRSFKSTTANKYMYSSGSEVVKPRAYKMKFPFMGKSYYSNKAHTTVASPQQRGVSHMLSSNHRKSTTDELVRTGGRYCNFPSLTINSS